MTRKMQAAQVEQFGQPLVLRELDIPTPSRGRILVKAKACGVCHTDLHAAGGDWPLKPALPFTPGLEDIGISIVTALGSGVTAVNKGDRVGVPWLHSDGGHCEFCQAAQEPVGAEAQFGGYTKNGGFVEFIAADPNYIAHIPAGLAARDAAQLICTAITAYQSLKETQARPGQWVLVSSIGDLGHLGAQYAKAMGLHVSAVDIDDRKLEDARRPGADAAVNARKGDPANCITIRGSFVGNRRDIAEALAFTADSKVKAEIELPPLSAINAVFERLAKGEVPSRGCWISRAA